MKVNAIMAFLPFGFNQHLFLFELKLHLQMLFANKLQIAIAASDILPRRTLESLTIVEIVYFSQGCLRVLYIPDLTLIKISSKP